MKPRRIALIGTLLIAAGTGRCFANPQPLDGLVNLRFQVSPQLFAVMAAVQLANPDSGTDGQPSGNVRKILRQRFSGISTDLREQIQRYCAARDSEPSVAQMQSKYISLGLVLGPPPAFKMTLKPDEVPEEAQSLIGFERLVAELWQEADLARAWEEARPNYVLEIEAYRPLIRDMIVSTLRYLHTEARIALDRQITLIPELLKSSGSVNARNTGHNYIVVVGPGIRGERSMRSVRHEYLHFLVDPLLAKYVAYLPEPSPFIKRVAEQPGALPRYRQDFYLMVMESLLQMIESRLDSPSGERRPAAVLEAYDQGLVLAPYFDEALLKFEAGSESLQEFFQGMVEAIRPEIEDKRSLSMADLRSRTRSQPPMSDPPDTAKDRIKELLSAANQHLGAREFSEAGELMEKALILDPGNAGALFGMAQVAARNQELERALGFYEKAIANAGADTWIAAWSMVHRGNIFQAMDDIDKARFEWSRVLNLHGNLRGALESARRALDQPSPPEDQAGNHEFVNLVPGIISRA